MKHLAKMQWDISILLPFRSCHCAKGYLDQKLSLLQLFIGLVWHLSLLEEIIVVNPVNKFPVFMEPKGLLSCSAAIGPFKSKMNPIHNLQPYFP